MRRGFTLVEILIAATLGAIVLSLAFRTFLDANKAKSQAIASGVLKVAGQNGMNEIYKTLHQNRHLFDRSVSTDTYLGRLPIVGLNASGTATCSPGVTAGDLKLPKVQLNGSFVAEDLAGTANPNFTADAIGNALFFAAAEPKAILDQGASNDLSAVFGSSTYLITPYRLHFYFLARRPLQAGLTYRGTSTYDYQLMHWRSKPYLDYKEIVLFLKKMKDYAGPLTLSTPVDTFIDQKLANLAVAFGGGMDLGVVDARIGAGLPAVQRLTAAPSHRDLLGDTTNLFKTERFGAALGFDMRASFGEPMICFNTFAATGPPATPAFVIPSLANPGVPAFAATNTLVPYGFEVGVAGPPDARQVLVRMVLAAVTMPGRVKVGDAFQQVVQIYDY